MLSTTATMDTDVVYRRVFSSTFVTIVQVAHATSAQFNISDLVANPYMDLMRRAENGPSVTGRTSKRVNCIILFLKKEVLLI